MKRLILFISLWAVFSVAALNSQNISPLTALGEEAFRAKKYKTAVEYFSQAAEEGDAQAQYRLGECYFFKKGVRRDYKKAAYWSEKAAQKGVASAQYLLGACYYKGKGVKKDAREAVESPLPSRNWVVVMPTVSALKRTILRPCVGFPRLPVKGLPKPNLRSVPVFMKVKA